MSNTKRFYSFGPFQLDVQGRVLLRDSKIIQLQPRAIDTLIALIERHGAVISKDELVKTVWQDAFVEESNLTLNISALRKALGDSASEPKYIETIPRRGYRFTAPLHEVLDENKREELTSINTTFFFAHRHRWVVAVVLVSVTVVGGLLYWQGRSLTLARSVIYSPADEAEIKRVVKESQIYETLTLYEKPEIFDEAHLKQYWLPRELGGKEIAEVKASVERLRNRGLRYGSDSRLERFDFTYVRIQSPGDYAQVGTIERWYLPLYAEDRRIQDRNVYLGPYSVDYTLRKVGGMWVIESSTTPRAK